MKNPLFYYNLKFIKSLVLFISFQLFFIDIKCYTPIFQDAHTATLVNDRLYYINGSQEKEFFYLDLFNISNAQRIDLPIKSNVSFARYEFTTSVTYNQQLIYYIGGKITRPDDLFIYTYNTSNEEWIVPNIVGRSFSQHHHQGIQAIIDKNGRI